MFFCVAVIAGDQYYSPMGPGSEGEPNTNNAVTGGENYEVMSGDAEPTNAAPLGDGAGEDYEAMEDDTAQGGQEDYEEPEPQQTEADKQASAPQDEEYEMPGEDSNYEGKYFGDFDSCNVYCLFTLTASF